MNRLGDQQQNKHHQQQQLEFKNSPKTPTSTINNSTSNLLRLLIGKIVYLDINTSYKYLGKVKDCLITIGANLADCMSKDVNYVITNRVKLDDLQSSTNDIIQKTSPTMNFSRTCAINRTQTILGNASKGSASNDIISIARKLGISVMHICEIEKYVEKYMQKCKTLVNNKKSDKKQLIEADLMIDNKANKARKLKAPYIKFESICKQYKPIYAEFKRWHDLVIDSTQKTYNSPFQANFSDENERINESSENQNIEETPRKQEQQQQASAIIPTSAVKNQSPHNNLISHCPSSVYDTQITPKTPFFQRTNSNISVSTSTASNQRALNLKTPVTLPKQSPIQPKKKTGGYCECCKQRFDNLKQHLTSLVHENFERNQINFKEIDVFCDGDLNFENFFKKFDPPVPEIIESKENFNEIEIDHEHELNNLNDKTLIEDENLQNDQTSEEKTPQQQNNIATVQQNFNENIEIDKNVEIINHQETIVHLNVTPIIKKISKPKGHSSKINNESLGEKRRESRQKSGIKYTELTAGDLNSILAATQSKEHKTKKRKRKETIEQLVTEPKKQLKTTFKRNKSKNGNEEWSISSNSLFEQSEKTPIKTTIQEPLRDNKSKRPKITNSPYVNKQLLEHSSYQNIEDYPRSASVPNIAAYHQHIQPQFQFNPQPVSPYHFWYFQYYQYQQAYQQISAQQPPQQHLLPQQSSFQRSQSFNVQQQVYQQASNYQQQYQQPIKSSNQFNSNSIFDALSEANSLVNGF